MGTTANQKKLFFNLYSLYYDETRTHLDWARMPR
jgi:hypothetical protein